jgi:small subunit ribosomal protein S16
VAADDRKPRDGKFIEVLGTYDPRKKDEKININKERFEYWVKNGARLSETVSHLV